MTNDIYNTEEDTTSGHTLRYVHITVRNVLGIVNRMTSVLRRRRYFIEDISVTFDETGNSHIVLVIDARLNDVPQVMRQLHKLHDIMDVRDMTDEAGKLFEAVYVHVKEEKDLDDLPTKPLRIILEKDAVVGVYLLQLNESFKFIEKLNKKNQHYTKRLIAMV